MPILHKAAKYGTIAYIGNKATKAYSEKNSNPQAPSPHPRQLQEQPYYPQQQRGQGTQIREANGYLHQTWCNGQCGMHCNDGMTQQQQQYGGGNGEINVSSREVPRIGESEAYHGGFNDETRDMGKTYENLPVYNKQ